MIAEMYRPSAFIADFRRSFRDTCTPGRPLTELGIAHLMAKLNTCFEMAKEYEADMSILEGAVMQREPVMPVVIDWDMGRPTPVRSRVDLRLIVSNDGKRE